MADDIQRAAMNDQLEHLPDGLFVLDQRQEKVMEAKLPLLLESVSCIDMYALLLSLYFGKKRGCSYYWV